MRIIVRIFSDVKGVYRCRSTYGGECFPMPDCLPGFESLPHRLILCGFQGGGCICMTVEFAMRTKTAKPIEVKVGSVGVKNLYDATPHHG